MANKKRRSYSLSIKQTDNPMIEEFLNAQTNYSESVRYLILKFCKEYGVQDISYMLSTMLVQDILAKSASQEIKEEIKEEVKPKKKAVKEIPDCYI